MGLVFVGTRSQLREKNKHLSSSVISSRRGKKVRREKEKKKTPALQSLMILESVTRRQSGQTLVKNQSRSFGS